MVLGLPTEIFVHEVLRLAALSSLAYVCVQRWHLGRWARLGAVSGCVGTLLYGYYLLSWVLLTQADIRGPIQLRDSAVFGTILTWLDLMVLVGIVAAVVADRPGFDKRLPATPGYDEAAPVTGDQPPRA
ncbi:hypothetical protein [Nocardioides sp.]|jgi:hypothetical protein|uniref:hypothetical protein n=1 Tax=Nocardioides sp. TaxID=35761 RepID=UPI00260A7E6D|nr:hypothetical protein [Nocardioides sp.]